MKKTILCALLLAALVVVAFEEYALGGAPDMLKDLESASRLETLARASIIGTHAFQVMLASDSGKGNKACYGDGGLSKADLEKLVAHQAGLLGDDTVEIAAWVRGAASKFDPAKDLEPLLAAPLTLSDKLPVNVFADYLSSSVEADRSDVLAVANLYQTCLEENRDGTVLWDEMHFFRALGYSTYVGEFGLPGADEDFFAVGEVLAPKTCESPFETDPAAWRIAARKVWNWGEKYGHVRDNFTMARELLAEPEIRALIPRIRALSPQRVAIIGHSFTMHSHWSTPGSFASTVTAVFQMENPGIVVRQWHGGGLTASRAINNFYEEALAWKPDKVLFVVAIRRDEDQKALKTMTEGFRAAGASVYAFDALRDPSESARQNDFGEDRAKEFGLEAIEVGDLLAAAPDKGEFVCLDNIHMTEGYHRLMAREWLKFLVGARGLTLETAPE